jgi:UDP-N-acetyl-D-glucosamine dehydrogenase
MPFYPGPGLGGHCIPIDPSYLTWKAREYGVPTRLIELAGEINTRMPSHVVARIAEAVDRVHGKGLRDSRILVCGAAYKADVDDVRESPSLRLIELLQRRGADVSYHDPLVATIPMTPEHPRIAGMASVHLEHLDGYDAVVIATDHSRVDYTRLAERCSLIVDTRNAFGRRGILGRNVVKA